MCGSLDAATALFHSLSDGTRLAILRRLAVSEARVVDLTASWRWRSRSTVSAHLACLRDCGLVDYRPQGRASVYRLARPELLEMFRAAAVPGGHRQRGRVVPPTTATHPRKKATRMSEACGCRQRRPRGRGRTRTRTALGGQRIARRRRGRGAAAGRLRVGWADGPRPVETGLYALALAVGAATFVPPPCGGWPAPDRGRHADDDRRRRCGDPRRGRRGRHAGVPVLHQRGPRRILTGPHLPRPARVAVPGPRSGHRPAQRHRNHHHPASCGSAIGCWSNPANAWPPTAPSCRGAPPWMFRSPANPVPVEAGPGDEVFAGSINGAPACWRSRSPAPPRITRWPGSGDRGSRAVPKGDAQRTADRIAKPLVPVIAVAAALIAAIGSVLGDPLRGSNGPWLMLVAALAALAISGAGGPWSPPGSARPAKLASWSTSGLRWKPRACAPSRWTRPHLDRQQAYSDRGGHHNGATHANRCRRGGLAARRREHPLAAAIPPPLMAWSAWQEDVEAVTGCRADRPPRWPPVAAGAARLARCRPLAGRPCRGHAGGRGHRGPRRRPRPG